jgi:ABC-type amino acid transport substrate-binding protein
VNLNQPLYFSIAVIFLVAVAFLLTRWGLRLFRWLHVVLTQKVSVGEAKLSDFISITSVSFTIIGAVLAYAGIAVQARKSDVEQRSKKYADSIASTEAKLQELDKAHSEGGSFEEPLGLLSPADDSHLISSAPYLEWSYMSHSDKMNYRVEVISLKGNAETADNCDGRAWTFFATEPAAQRTQILSCEAASSSLPSSALGLVLSPGEYLWRVQPAKVSIDELGNETVSSLGDWSEFSSFSLYQSISQRILLTGRVLVGTAYSANPGFSGLDSASRLAGHDIDLIRLLIKGCLTRSPSLHTIDYDKKRCDDTIETYISLCRPRTNRASRQCSAFLEECKPNELCPAFRLFPSASEGLQALGRREVDVFVGSLTRAKSRQNTYDVRFTNGYYSFDSKLYGKNVAPGTTIKEWLETDNRTIGVVENSTNNWLATELASEAMKDHTISVVRFRSVPELEDAFDRGEVDGVLMDEVKRPSTSGMQEIKGITSSDAWRKFKKQIGFEGSEQFAIAVAASEGEDLSAPCDFQVNWVFKRLGRFDSSNSLFCPLEHGLEDNYPGKLAGPIADNFDIPISH